MFLSFELADDDVVMGLRQKGRDVGWVVLQVIIHGDNHVILRRVLHHEHRHRIDILVISFNLCVTSSDFPEDALPEITAEALDV